MASFFLSRFQLTNIGVEKLGITQGLVLFLILFNMYMKQLGKVTSQFRIRYHQYV